MYLLQQDDYVWNPRAMTLKRALSLQNACATGPEKARKRLKIAPNDQYECQETITKTCYYINLLVSSQIYICGGHGKQKCI